MRNLGLLVLFSSLLSCASHDIPEPRTLSILSFNIQKRTETLKLSDKLMGVAQVIAESTTGCPDYVFVQGLESESALLRLKSFLPCSYVDQSFAQSAPSSIAILSKFPIEKSETSMKNNPKNKASILNLSLKREIPMQFWGVHLLNSKSMSSEVALLLNAKFLESQRATILAGDWGVDGADSAAAWQILRKDFVLSDELLRNGSSLGTSLENGQWSFRGKILLSRNAFDQITCQLANNLPGQRNSMGEPAGVSEHFPVLCKAAY